MESSVISHPASTAQRRPHERLRGQIAGREPGGTWLCRNDLARSRLVELDGFLQPAYPVVGVAAVLSIIAAMLASGPWALLPLAGFAPMLFVVRTRVRKVAKPEYLIAPAALTLISTLAVATVQTGGLSSPLAFWLLVPAVALPTRFDARGVVAGLTLLLGVLAVAALTLGGAAEEMEPAARAFGFTAALLAFATFATILAGAEFRYRTASALDPLTGLLNRAALEPRFEELHQQASLTSAPICLIACDIDHFKRINDTYGHQHGDNVLQEVAGILRGNLRSFELVYRVGGEEFLIVLPGADLARGQAVAERLRDSIASAMPGGLRVTVSLGVTAGAGRGATLKELYRRADTALYAAKDAGRGCVRVDPHPPMPHDPSLDRRTLGGKAA